MKMKRIKIGDKSIVVEYEYFLMMLAQWSQTMAREEIDQFLVDSWVADPI